ncbi:hypothetical protein MNB_SV-6-516 [hydrothermal vent metagenome]|uniref:Uncharacterized protein n=1 Tax=hydrothermal vent metagenome TaxID=652676 RepID=A0A1W1CAV5_9ZZZZ
MKVDTTQNRLQYPPRKSIPRRYQMMKCCKKSYAIRGER